MTDEQIIKALECCQYEGVTTCRDCPMFYTHEFDDEIDFDCGKYICGQAVEIINRQQAEIERLQKIIVGFMDEVGTWSNKYDVDISAIHKLPLLAKEDFNIRNKIKSEAIKEFAERLKKVMVATHKDINGYRQYRTEDCEIDNLLAEMTNNTFTKIEHNSLCETEIYEGRGAYERKVSDT